MDKTVFDPIIEYLDNKALTDDNPQVVIFGPDNEFTPQQIETIMGIGWDIKDWEFGEDGGRYKATIYFIHIGTGLKVEGNKILES